MADCERDLNMAETTSKQDLICKKCAIKRIGGGQFNCAKHGHKFITWKCNFCCSEALFRCAGSAFFCDDCHNGDRPEEVPDCVGGAGCPLGVPHPPATSGEDGQAGNLKAMYPLGCSLCRKVKNLEEDRSGAIEEVQLDDQEIEYVQNEEEF